MSEWISVNDALPARGREVLVYRPNAPATGDPVIRTAFYGRRGMNGHDLEGFACYVQPTHWMPLPEPPQ